MTGTQSRQGLGMPKHTTHIITLLLGLLAMLTGPAVAQGDPVTVEVELSRSRVYVGDELTYQVIVRNADNPPTPQIAFPASVRAQYHGRTSQSFTSMQSINGRTRTVTDQRFSFQYTLTALEQGTISIPAPTVTIDAQQYTGQAASFESLFPVKSDDDDLEMHIDRNEIYQNQTIEVSCVWWIGDQTSDFSLSSTPIPDSFELRGTNPPNRGGQRVTFELHGEQIAGVVDSGIHNGREMTRFAFSFSITPTQTGSFDLGPLRAVFTRLSGAGRGYRAYAESKPIRLTVNPVPDAGKPDGYTGAIGEYQLRTMASNTTVNVGDPITLTLRINAPEPMVGVDNAPSISTDPRFTDRFKIASEGWREVLPRQDGQRVYGITIRALDASVDQIPSIRLPSFSPASGSYKVFESQPIEIAVNPVQEVTLSDAIVTGGSSTTGPASPPRREVERTELTRAMPGLWAHGSVDDLLDQHGFDLGQTLSRPVWIVAVGSGPALFALALVFIAVRRSSDARTRAIRKAYRHARLLDKQGDHARALRVYLSAALGINERAVTADDARQLPIDNETGDSLRAQLNIQERRGYLDRPDDTNASHAGVIELLRRIHKQVLHAGGPRGALTGEVAS